MKNIYIHVNKSRHSQEAAGEIRKVLSEGGFNIAQEYSPETELVIAVGGDGAFLKGIAAMGYASTPILGVNTGHLGFFQDLKPDNIASLRELIEGEKFTIQKHRLLEADVTSEGGETSYKALNDIVLRDEEQRTVHLQLGIGDNFIEYFSGDGIIVSSSAGSTAYNYSLGGSIVDPSLELLQLTPVAPINNRAYRSFTSSLILPANMDIVVEQNNTRTRKLCLQIDGRMLRLEKISKVKFRLSKDEVQICRMPDYDFWGKLKSKFL